MTAAVDWAVDSLIALEAGTQPPQKAWTVADERRHTSSRDHALSMKLHT